MGSGESRVCSGPGLLFGEDEQVKKFKEEALTKGQQIEAMESEVENLKSTFEAWRIQHGLPSDIGDGSGTFSDINGYIQELRNFMAKLRADNDALNNRINELQQGLQSTEAEKHQALQQAGAVGRKHDASLETHLGQQTKLQASLAKANNELEQARQKAAELTSAKEELVLEHNNEVVQLKQAHQEMVDRLIETQSELSGRLAMYETKSPKATGNKPGRGYDMGSVGADDITMRMVALQKKISDAHDQSSTTLSDQVRELETEIAAQAEAKRRASKVAKGGIVIQPNPPPDNSFLSQVRAAQE